MIKVKMRDQYDIDLSSSNLSELQKTILRSRLTNNNINNFDSIEDIYCNKIDMSYLYELSSKLPDASKVDEIFKDVDKNQHICIVSDFDTDGVTSAVVIEKSLDILGYNNKTTIINKRKYGTGVTRYCMDAISSDQVMNNIDIMLLSDHGSSNEDEYAIIKKNIPGIKIVLTDHHQVDDNNYPNSVDAFVNPQVMKDSNVLKKLSGCAVAYLTMLRIAGKDNYKLLEQLLYLVGISTISDVMPLDNPVNRYFVRTGMNMLYTNWSSILTKVLSADKVYAKDLSFRVIPTINSGNRTNNEELSYGYVKNDPESMAMLESINNDRKRETNRIKTIVLNNIDSFKLDNSIIAIIDSIYAIAGNVAGMIGEMYNVPTMILTEIDREILTGSIRGILPSVDVVKVLRDIEAEDNTILIRYGGHTGAAGCSLYKCKIDKFRELFNKYVNEQVKDVDTTKTIQVDIDLKDSDITPSVFKAIDRIGPYGNKWDDAVFRSKLYLFTIIPIGTISKLLFRTSTGLEIDGIIRQPKSRIEKFIGENITVIYNMEVYNQRRASILSLAVLHIEEMD